MYLIVFITGVIDTIATPQLHKNPSLVIYRLIVICQSLKLGEKSYRKNAVPKARRKAW